MKIDEFTQFVHSEQAVKKKRDEALSSWFLGKTPKKKPVVDIPAPKTGNRIAITVDRVNKTILFTEFQNELRGVIGYRAPNDIDVKSIHYPEFKIPVHSGRHTLFLPGTETSHDSRVVDLKLSSGKNVDAFVFALNKCCAAYNIGFAVTVKA